MACLPLPLMHHVQEERQRLAAGMAAAVAHTSAPAGAAPTAIAAAGGAGGAGALGPSGAPPPPPGGGLPSQLGGDGGVNGEVGGGEDSLLADADFSRFILGEDPMPEQGYSGVEGGGLDDDYDPENPF